MTQPVTLSEELIARNSAQLLKEGCDPKVVEAGANYLRAVYLAYKRKEEKEKGLDQVAVVMPDGSIL